MQKVGQIRKQSRSWTQGCQTVLLQPHECGEVGRGQGIEKEWRPDINTDGTVTESTEFRQRGSPETRAENLQRLAGRCVSRGVGALANLIAESPPTSYPGKAAGSQCRAVSTVAWWTRVLLEREGPSCSLFSTHWTLTSPLLQNGFLGRFLRKAIPIHSLLYLLLVNGFFLWAASPWGWCSGDNP